MPAGRRQGNKMMFRSWSTIAVLALALSAAALPACAAGKVEYAVRTDTRGDAVIYPPAARLNGEEGGVDVVFLVGADGAVTDPAVWLSSGYPRLDAAALDAVRARQYRPATMDGKPATQWKTAVFEFRIEGATAAEAPARAAVENCILFDADAAAQVAGCGEVLALPSLTPRGRLGALQKRAIVYQRLGRFGDALADHSAILAIAPTDTASLAGRARDHAVLGEYAAAADDLTQVLNLKPDDQNALYRRAEVFQELRRLDDASSDLDRLALLAPANPLVPFMHSQVRDEQNRYDDALREATEAIRLGPDVPAYLRLRAWLYRRHRDFASAFADIERAIALKAGDSYNFDMRCLTYAAQGDLKAAIADCDKAITLAPERTENRDARAIVYFLMGKYALVIADEDAVLAHAPYAQTRYLRGLAKLKLGDKAQGRADLAAALQIDMRAADDLAEFGIKP